MAQPIRRATSFVSSTYLYNPDSARLGRIVLNPQEPLESYYDLFPGQNELKDTGEIYVTPGINLACTFNSNKEKSIRGALLQLFSVLFSTSNEKGMDLRGETRRYQLGNAEPLFRNACAKDGVREWLQENVIKPKVDAYMIVGYHTIINPQVTNNRRATTAQVDNAIISAGMPGLAGIVNVTASVSASARNQNSFKHEISAMGEGIWAVQYRKVVYKIEHWLSGSQIKLKDSRWQMMWHVRGQDTSGEYLVEADLGDAAEPDPEDSDDDDEDKVVQESYFDMADVSGEDGEEVREEFIFYQEEEGEYPGAQLPYTTEGLPFVIN